MLVYLIVLVLEVVDGDFDVVVALVDNEVVEVDLASLNSVAVFVTGISRDAVVVIRSFVFLVIGSGGGISCVLLVVLVLNIIFAYDCRSLDVLLKYCLDLLYESSNESDWTNFFATDLDCLSTTVDIAFVVSGSVVDDPVFDDDGIKFTGGVSSVVLDIVVDALESDSFKSDLPLEGADIKFADGVPSVLDVVVVDVVECGSFGIVLPVEDADIKFSVGVSSVVLDGVAVDVTVVPSESVAADGDADDVGFENDLLELDFVVFDKSVRVTGSLSVLYALADGSEVEISVVVCVDFVLIRVPVVVDSCDVDVFVFIADSRTAGLVDFSKERKRVKR